MESVTMCRTPAACAAARRLVTVVRKKSTEASSKVGELETFTTTSASRRASSSPPPVSRSTPVDSECPAASCPAAVSRSTTWEPMRPVPMTAIFMSSPLCGTSVPDIRCLLEAGFRPQVLAPSSRAGSAAVAPRLQLFGADRHDHRPAGHAEHGDEETGLGVREVVRVLIVDDVVSGLVEGLAGLDHPLRLALELEEQLALEDVAVARAGVAVRRQAARARRQRDQDGHRLGPLRHRRGIGDGADH